MAAVRAPRLGRAPARAGRQGRVMSHRARRQLAPSPDAIADRVARHVGAAFEAWARRFVQLVVSDFVPTKFRADATLQGLFEEAGHADPERKLLEEAFRGLDKQSADEVRVAGVRTADVVPGGPALQQRWIRQNTDLIKAEADLRRRVERVISDPLNEGRSVADIAKLLEEQVGYSKSRAELTARDQTLKLYGQIQEERQTKAGITQYIWTTSLDERVREDHAALDGTVQEWDDPPIVDQRTGRRGHPGSDFQCLPGHAQIGFTGTVHRAFRRAYCGQLTTLVTDTGETFECTPNHPVLTDTGWQPAQRVQVGDYVVQARLDRGELAKADVEHRETGAAEIFEAHALAFGTRRPRAVAPQFHGDLLVDQQIHVVDVDRRLRPDVETELRQRLTEFDFADTDPPGLSMRQADLVLQAQGLAAHGGVGGLRYRLALFLARVRKARDVGGASIARIHALTDQEGADGLARHAVPLSQSFDAGTLPLQLQAFIMREWLRVRRADVNAAAPVHRADTLPDRLFVDADLACDIGPGLTLRTKLARVVENRSSDFSGHVFNLQTDSNWYVAQRLITHNCRCTAVPVLPDFDDEPPAERGPAPEPPPRDEAMRPTPGEVEAHAAQRAADAARRRAEAEADLRIARASEMRRATEAASRALEPPVTTSGVAIDIRNLSHVELGADKFRPGVLEALRKDKGFLSSGRTTSGAKSNAKSGLDHLQIVMKSPEGKGPLQGEGWFLRDGSHRLQVARELGIETLPATVYDIHGNVLFKGDIPITPRGADASWRAAYRRTADLQAQERDRAAREFAAAERARIAAERAAELDARDRSR